MYSEKEKAKHNHNISAFSASSMGYIRSTSQSILYIPTNENSSESFHFRASHLHPRTSNCAKLCSCSEQELTVFSRTSSDILPQWSLLWCSPFSPQSAANICAKKGRVCSEERAQKEKQQRGMGTPVCLPDTVGKSKTMERRKQLTLQERNYCISRHSTEAGQ